MRKFLVLLLTLSVTLSVSAKSKKHKKSNDRSRSGVVVVADPVDGEGKKGDIPVGPDEVFQTNTEHNEIKIMAYNVLNLFDAEKDPIAWDWTYLPKNYPAKKEHCEEEHLGVDFCVNLDWTDRKVTQKIEQLYKVVSFQGSLPDIMGLVEVENENVVGKLAKRLGYKGYVVTNTKTRRGIDLGLMYNESDKLKFVSSSFLDTESVSAVRTRDILKVEFLFNGEPLTVYVNHWMSQQGPSEGRINTARILRDDIDKQMAVKGRNFHAVAVGDFNVIENEQPHAIDDVLYDGVWTHKMLDGQAMAKKSANPALKYMPSGTFYFRKDNVWNRFDRVIMTKSLNDSAAIEFVPESFRILFPEFMSFRSAKGRIPNKYNPFTEVEEQMGFSDHLPVVFKLKVN